MRALHPLRSRLARFPGKLRAPLRPGSRNPRSWRHVVWSFLTSAAGILAVTGVSSLAGHQLLIGSFGASCVLLYATPESPLAQPRNLLGGHVLSALAGVAVHQSGASGPLSLALAVAAAIAVMSVSHTVHPPGGATALIAAHDHAGWLFPLVPVGVGALVLLLVALMANNIVHHRRYPAHWW